MSKRLTTQISEYFEFVDEYQGAVDIAKVQERRLGEGPIRLIQPAPPSPRRPRRWLIGVAAAIVVLLVGGVALLVRSVRDNEPSPVAETSPVPQDPGEALAIANLFYAEYNVGDVERVLSLFATDGDAATEHSLNLDALRAELTWNVIQETQFSQLDCTAGQATSRDLLRFGELSAEPVTEIDAMRVTCRYTYGPLLFRASGEEVKGEARLVIANNEVVFFADRLIASTHAFFDREFREWLEAVHPEDSATAFVDRGLTPVSVESAELRNRYAEDFAASPEIRTRYQVLSVVTESFWTEETRGELAPGYESQSTWTFFGCSDGRCDAAVHAGGAPFSYGEWIPPFNATYQPDSEDFIFDFAEDTSNTEFCPIRWAGEITPTGWDDRGPTQFTFTAAVVHKCDTRDFVLEWEGEGVRN